MLDRESRVHLFGRFGLLGWALAIFFVLFGSSYVPWSSMSASKTIEDQLSDVFGAESRNPQVIRIWRGKDKALCGNIVKFTARAEAFATRFVAQPDGSHAIARDLDSDNSPITAWQRRLGPASTKIFSSEEIRQALAEIEEKNVTFDKKWAVYCAKYPPPR